MSPSASPPKSRILELHGTLARVHCMAHRHEQHRDEYQEQLGRMNPLWQEMSDEAERTGRRPRTNPDGDVRLLSTPIPLLSEETWCGGSTDIWRRSN